MSHRDAIHKEEYKGLNIYIIPDDDPGMNPIEDFDMLGKQVYWHRRMNLGHEQPKCRPHEWFEDKLNKEDLSLKDGWKEFEKKNLIIPVHAYEHGGITISTSPRAGWDSFDSGQLGFVYVSHEDIKKEYGVKRLTKKVLERAEKCLHAEVSGYDDYLTGQVYGFIIEDENDEELDSCWGFIGDYKYCLEEAKSSADYWAEQKEKELKRYDE